MRVPIAVVALLLCHEETLSASQDGVRPRFHAATYASDFDQRLQLPLVTAERHGFYPVVVGYGKSARWAYGLSDLANSFRDYVFKRTDPDDVVMFFDAFDIMFQAGEEEIVEKYMEMERRTGRTLFYSGENRCTNPCLVEKPTSEGPWRYLNSGTYIGRSRAFRELYREPLPKTLVFEDGAPMRLQYWHVLFYMKHQDMVMIDADCELAQVVFNVDNVHVNSFHPDVHKQPGGHGLSVVKGKLVNQITNTTPPVLHFPGSGHWPDWAHPQRVGTCPAYELFRTIGHPELALLMEEESKGAFLGLQPWKALCTKSVLGFEVLGMEFVRVQETAIWSYFHIFPVCCLILATVSYAAFLLGRGAWRWWHERHIKSTRTLQ